MPDIPFLSHLEPPDSINWTGLWAAGQTITFAWTSATVDAPCGSYLFAVDANTNGGDLLGETHESSTGAGSVSFTLLHNCTEISLNAFTDGYCSSGTLHAVSVSPAGAPVYCQYGTELQTPGTFIYYLTPGLIDTILAATGEAWAAPFLTALWFTTVNAQTLCGNLPPVSPTLTIEDFVGPSPLESFGDFMAKLYLWLEARMWNYF